MAAMDPALAIEIAAVSRQRALIQAAAGQDSETRQFYQGSTGLVTGGSGFMGKQLVEKLFRSCQLAKLYIIIRPKKGKSVQERLNDLFEDAVFEPLRAQQPSFHQYIVAVEGDVGAPRLGVSDQDWQTMTREVNVIFHLAATTRFDEVLKTATFINVRGTREVIEFAKACENLKSFVHVSSAYALAMKHLIRADVHETFYDSAISPHTLIEMAETMDEQRFNSLTKPLIEGWPNTYTFTKAVAEELVRSCTDGLPVCVVRPGIVVSTLREPLPGWLDMSCAYGASGMVIGMGLGLTHCFLTHKDTRLGLVPCDYANNAIITAGKAVGGTTGGQSTKIYVVNSIARNPLYMGVVGNEFEKSGRKYVSPKALYYNFLYLTPNKFIHGFIMLLTQLIPAYLADFVCLLLGKERRFVKLCTKVNNVTQVLSYFTLNDWSFKDDNLVELHKHQSKTDKLLYNFDITDVNWEEYCTLWGIGIRKYVVKDGLKGTEAAVKRQFWYKILHYIICALYLYVFWRIISVTFSIVSIVFLFWKWICNY